MGHAEYEDIRVIGRFRPGEGMMERKWFADTYQGVLLHAEGLYPDGDYHIVSAEVSKDILDRLYRPENLDRFGPATYLEADDLSMITPILEFDTRDD